MTDSRASGLAEQTAPPVRIVAAAEAEIALRNELADAVPAWVTGCPSRDDIAFLLHLVMAHTPRHVVEVGTGSGVSTAVIVRGLEAAAEAAGTLDDFSVVTYDVSSQLWFDDDRAVGEAASSLASSETLAHVTFRNPATAVDAAREHEANSVPFVFLDALHTHPWPTLDLLALLECLRPGAIVVLHDINLPVLNEEFQVWGVKWLFDDLDIVRFAAEGDPPNTGAIMVPADKGRLRGELIQIIASHEWELDAPDHLLLALDVQRPSP